MLSALQWIRRSTGSSAPIFRAVCVWGGFSMASDGYRCHVSSEDDIGLTEGLWNRAGSQVDGRYPVHDCLRLALVPEDGDGVWLENLDSVVRSARHLVLAMREQSGSAGLRSGLPIPHPVRVMTTEAREVIVHPVHFLDAMEGLQSPEIMRGLMAFGPRLINDPTSDVIVMTNWLDNRFAVIGKLHPSAEGKWQPKPLFRLRAHSWAAAPYQDMKERSRKGSLHPTGDYRRLATAALAITSAYDAASRCKAGKVNVAAAQDTVAAARRLLTSLSPLPSWSRRMKGIRRKIKALSAAIPDGLSKYSGLDRSAARWSRTHAYYAQLEQSARRIREG
jgi:hypothetical protein